MPRKSTRKRRVRKLKGKGIKEILGKAKAFLKRTKLISSTADAMKSHVPALAYPISTLAKSYGYGSKKRTRKGTRKGTRVGKRNLRGKGFMDFLKKANDFLKKTKIISTIGNAVGTVLPVAGTIGRVAGAAGYGKRRTRTRGRGINPQMGDGFGGTAKFSAGVVGMGRKGGKYGKRSMRGKGIGHLYTPYSSVGIPGAAVYSTGKVLF